MAVAPRTIGVGGTVCFNRVNPVNPGKNQQFAGLLSCWVGLGWVGDEAEA